MMELCVHCIDRRLENKTVLQHVMRTTARHSLHLLFD